jgi:hypothetical protein
LAHKFKVPPARITCMRKAVGKNNQVSIGASLTQRKIPSISDCHSTTWSWIAVMGLIKYMNIPFDTVEWSRDLDHTLNPPVAPKAVR